MIFGFFHSFKGEFSKFLLKLITINVSSYVALFIAKSNIKDNREPKILKDNECFVERLVTQ